MRKLAVLFVFTALPALALGILSVSAPGAHAQATIASGTIQGTILDPKGATVSSAKVTITNKATGAKLSPEVNGSGIYNTGTITPGVYAVRIEAKGFKATELDLTVQVGVITQGNVTLELGSESTVVVVEGSSVTVNTDQATVQGVLTSDEIKNLPINGRNFLDLAQLEPGVQIQDGGNFDPTKHGYSSISFGGRAGRTARIEVDGLDISDETVGTTTQNVPVIGIKEFQISQSSLDLSTELTSSGSVNIVTNTGTNNFHGDGYFNYRGDPTSARLGPAGAVPFDRKQYGASLGGPIYKDKLFFFGGWERTTQSLQEAVVLGSPFNALDNSFNAPFFDNQFIARLDYQIKPGWNIFYKFGFEQNLNDAAFIQNTFSPFANVDHTPSHAIGFDFVTGKFSHSIRFGYLKFRNGIADGSNGVFNPALGAAISIGPSASCTGSGDAFCSGPNILAPQQTYQSNKQFKYDGSVTVGPHVIRYGTGVNRILGGGLASFFGLAPTINSSFTSTELAFAAAGPFPGGSGNPLNYPAEVVIFGNGQGFSTERPQFGLPAGGEYDTRFQAYIGDSWKIKPNLSLIYGMRYNRDTGRADSDLAPIPCSELNSSLGTCTGNILDLFGPGLGNRVNQPNHNFGGNLGLAWDPFKTGKTALRAGVGLNYENAVFNNVLFDRSPRLPTGLFFGTATACPAGSVPLPGGGSIDTSALCGQPIGNVFKQLAADELQFQQATIKAGAAANGAFIGNTLAAGNDSTGTQLIAPNYKTPYSMQFNAGIQRELHKGTVLTVDYVRNVGLRYLVGVDTNHTGDAKTLNSTAALNAINLTNTHFGCPAGTAGINCAIAAGATITNYAGNGLDSGRAFLSGFPAAFFGLTPDTGAAFPGNNPLVGENQMLFPIGRSVYNGLQVSLKSQLEHPLPGVKHADLTFSYALSRFDSLVADQDFINNATDFNNPTKFFGPNGLDRKHQLSAGGYFDLPFTTRLGFITHYYSPLPQTLTIPVGATAGAIFQSDVTGDGTIGDVLPGTNVGSFGRGISPGDLNNVINNFNKNFAGQLTPAGQALVAAGLFTQTQLASLGGVIQPIANAPANNIGLNSFFTFDLTLGWRIKPIRSWEHLVIQPQVAFYNLFNKQNYDAPGNTLSGVLSGQQGSVNGTTAHDQAGCPADPTKCTGRTNLIGLGSGVFGLGAPRAIEFGFKASF
jgi:Carboxypeptidase regulatory-like domain